MSKVFNGTQIPTILYHALKNPDGPAGDLNHAKVA